MISRRQGGGA